MNKKQQWLIMACLTGGVAAAFSLALPARTQRVALQELTLTKETKSKVTLVARSTVIGTAGNAYGSDGTTYVGTAGNYFGSDGTTYVGTANNYFGSDGSTVIGTANTYIGASVHVGLVDSLMNRGAMPSPKMALAQ